MIDFAIMIQPDQFEGLKIPPWLGFVFMLFGSGGIVWVIWSKFGEAIRSGFSIKNDVKSGNLNNESQEIDVMAKYKAFLNKEMDDLMVRYTKLKVQVESDHKKLTEQIKANRAIMERQKNYIKYSQGKLKENKIEHKPYTDE